MRLYLVEGTITHADKMTDDIMSEHKKYTQKWMDEGKILLSSLKSDMSGGLFIAKVNDEAILQSFLDEEPFFCHDIQTYTIQPIDVHYMNEDLSNWLK